MGLPWEKADYLRDGKPPARMWLVVLFVLLAGGLLQASGAYAEPVFPKLTGHIVDQAGILSDADRASILQKLKALEGKSSDQLVVVTLTSLQGYAIEDFGVQLGRHWGIGRKDKNNGVLLIVAPKERKVRIEVGYGLESELTDTLAGNIIHNRILPRFRKGQMAKGIVLGVDDIIGVMTGNAEEVAQRAKGRKGKKGGVDWGFMFVLGLWGFMFFGGALRSLFGSSSERGGIIIVPASKAGSHWNNSGFGGGSFGGGSFGGGGFSGGGGSFGGGGASGGW